MVLSEGQIIEFDTPSNLLELKGVFYNMAKDSNLVSWQTTAADKWLEYNSSY